MFWSVLWERFQGRFVREWRDVSEAEARGNPLYGFWGWLLIGYLAHLYALASELLSLRSVPTESALALYGSVEGYWFTSAVYFTASMPPLILAPLKHRLFPKAYAVSVIAFLVSILIAIDKSQIRALTVIVVVPGFVTPLLFVWYVLRSKRVNVTYLHRVPARAATYKKIAPVPSLQKANRRERIFWISAAILGGLIALGYFTNR